MAAFSICTYPMGYWRCRVCCFRHQVLLASPEIKDAKMGGTADFGYDIIYGSYIVGGALSCSVQVTGVQTKANCSLWLFCNHSRVDPWRVFIVYLFKDICFIP